MKNVADSSNVVIVGNWNRYILSPNWLAKNIFETDKIQVEIGMNSGLPPRYTYENIRIAPESDKIVIVALDHTEDALLKIEKYIHKLLSLLIHTPVKAFGINFSYIETDDLSKLSSIFAFNDNTRIVDKSGNIKSYSLNRNINYSGSNFNYSMIYNTSNVQFIFNFHYDVISCDNILSIISNLIVNNRNISLDFIENIYDIKLETENE